MSRDELIDAIWPDADIEPNNLSQHVAKVRRLLGEKPGENRYIETVAGRGYRFVADVRFAAAAQCPAAGSDPHRPRNEQALEQYRQALRMLQRPTADNFTRAEALLEAAVALDPQFARGWAWLADVHLFAVNIGQAPQERLAQAKRHAEHALRLDGQLAIAHIVLGVVDAQHGAWLGAESHFRQALSLDPADAPEAQTPGLALHAGFVLQQVGHVRRALQQTSDAYRRMPDDPRMLMNLAMAHFHAGEDARAMECARLAVAFGYPEGTFPLQLVPVHAAARAGRYAEAAEQALRLLPAALGAAEAIRLVYRALAEPHLREQAVAAVSRLVERCSAQALTRSGVPMLFVEWLTQLGRIDLAFDLADRALAPSWQTLWLPELLPLRGDRRFRLLADRLGFSAYWRVYGPPDCPAVRALIGTA